MNRKRELGFTLVEVLIAMVIFLIIVFPFLSSYIVSERMNRQSFYMKRAIEAVDMAGNDISTWDQDILETICQKDDDKKEWKYLNTEGGLSMYQAFRKLLDDDTVDTLDINGKQWGDNLDVYFKVEEDNGENISEDESDELRSDYDLRIRVEDKIRMIYKASASSNDTTVTENTDNNGSGYYLKVTLDNNGKYSFVVRRIPDDYKPLEKIDLGNKILFGGRRWEKLFKASAGDVALIYAPENESYELQLPFDISDSTPRFKRGNQDSTWGNIASYLNNEFYNSLVYSTYEGENYNTNRNWIKKHTWNIGERDNDTLETTVENVGLLSYNELSFVENQIESRLGNSYTLTPQGNLVRTVSGNTVLPTTYLNVYPVIYLDKDLYCDTSDLEYKLYDGTSDKLKSGTKIVEFTVSGDTPKALIYFDKNLKATNLEGEYFEKLRLLVEVEDKRTSSSSDGLTIYTINNRNVGNYSWLSINDATRKFLGDDNLKGFRLIDSIYLENDSKKANSDSNLKKVFIVNGYKVTVWAEYMAPDEYRYNKDSGTVSEYMKEQERLEIHINKEKDRPTFWYKSKDETEYKETNNIRDVKDILDSDGNKRVG